LPEVALGTNTTSASQLRQVAISHAPPWRHDRSPGTSPCDPDASSCLARAGSGRRGAHARARRGAPPRSARRPGTSLAAGAPSGHVSRPALEPAGAGAKRAPDVERLVVGDVLPEDVHALQPVERVAPVPVLDRGARPLL